MTSHQVAICQPHYIPWIGYFEMIDRVDEFIFLDDVDVIHRDWKTRNRIRKERASSETKWLSVPIVHECRRKTPIFEARIGGDGNWRQTHFDAFTMVYAEAPFFVEANTLFERCLTPRAETIGDLNVHMVQRICAHLGIATPTRRASKTPTLGRKTEKLVALCEVAQATHYLANNGSAGYLDTERFSAADIALAFQDYEHPTYEQKSGKQSLPFLSHLSVFDLIANHGPASLEILRQGRPSLAV